MAATDTTATLAEIVRVAPGAVRIFEAKGLDYCCNGEVALAAACDSIGIDAAQVAAEIDALEVTGPAPWASLSVGELVDQIESTHHAYLHAEFDRLDMLAEKVAVVHGERHPELAAIRDTWKALRADLEPHLAKEERVLFPLIRALDSPAAERPSQSLRAPIAMMMQEHEQAGALLEELRRLTNGYQAPADGCGSYHALFAGLAELEADTHLHIHKENHALFPAVLEMESATLPS